VRKLPENKYEKKREIVSKRNRPLLQSLAMFSPSGFPELVENFQNARDLEASITSFCTTYRTYCAKELFTFAR
jgi:hypothetical protein